MTPLRPSSSDDWLSPADFGDPALVNRDLVPVEATRRWLMPSDRLVLWAAVGAGPVSYAAALGGERRQALVPLVLALILTLLLGLALSRSSSRFGAGAVLGMRAAFGPRGARLPLLVRAAIGVLLTASWALMLGTWTGRLVARSVPEEPWFASPWGLRSVAWGVALVLFGLGALLAAGDLPRLRRGLDGLLMLGLCAGFGLVVWAGITSQGFGPLSVEAPMLWARGLELFAGLMPVGLVIALSAPDWERLTCGRDQPQRFGFQLAGILAPWGAPLMAVVTALVGGLLAAASGVVRGSADGHAIPDAAGFGGLAIGWAGVGFSALLWLLPGSLVGLYSPALALVAALPKQFSRRRALLAWVGFAVVAVPLLDLLAAGPYVASWLLLLAPVVGVLLADEWLLRRGQLVLDEIYTAGNTYGPVFGVRLAAYLAWGLGAVCHPQLLGVALMQLLVTKFHWVGISAPEVALLGGVILAALGYGVLAPIEGRLAALVRTALTPRAKALPMDALGTAERVVPVSLSTEATATLSKPLPTEENTDPEKRFFSP